MLNHCTTIKHVLILPIVCTPLQLLYHRRQNDA